MIEPSHVALRLRCSCAAFLLACAAIVVAAPAHAQEPASGVVAAREHPASENPATQDPTSNGMTLIHGNYCGVGSRPGAPIDALDVACMHHDACTPTGGIPTCDCNARLRDEAAAVAQDPRQALELQSLASLTAAAAAVMICKPMTSAAAPPAPATSTPVNQAPVAAEPVSIVPVTVAPVSAAPVSTAAESKAPSLP
jgi:hypothetical protein